MRYQHLCRKACIVAAALCAILITATAAVPVHINSGNPRYPFPQFLEYAAGGNLGTKNAEGVVHAEMEQDIRDAYQIHANEFDYTGQSYKGIKYIWTSYKAAYDCTEGDGYGLLAAAYMADKVTFDGYWMCTHDKRRVKTKRYADCSAMRLTMATAILPSAIMERAATPLPMAMWTWRWPCMWPICNGANSCSMITATRCLMPAENPSPIKKR